VERKITVQGIDKVLAFLPLFERSDTTLYEVRTDLSLFDPYVYSNEVDEFIEILSSEEFVTPFDWSTWQNEAAKFVEQPKLLESAELTILQKLLTTHIRKERFHSGHLAAMIDNGHILAILKRLKQIRLDMESSEQINPNLSEKISVIQGDITKEQVDAIVNAANQSLLGKESLLGGGGVDGAIHRAAGKQLLEECRTLGGCPTGEAKITQGYKLPAKWVIHTVGPIWRGGRNGEDESLRSCYRNSLNLARQKEIRTIAFPAISTGLFLFPLERATQIAVNEAKHFLSENSSFERVIFVCFDDDSYRCYLKAVSELVS
jgi:O-acetyl-ADP-ribose deacetylase (regulator of RNase III)